MTVYYIKGTLLEMKGQLREAEDVFKDLLKLYPNDV